MQAMKEIWEKMLALTDACAKTPHNAISLDADFITEAGDLNKTNAPLKNIIEQEDFLY